MSRATLSILIIVVIATPAMLTAWENVYTIDGGDAIYSIIPTADSNYVATGIANALDPDNERDVWVTKIDADGNTIWSHTYGVVADDLGNGIISTPDDGYLVVGTQTNFTNHKIWLLKLDANGDTIWTRTYGETRSNSGHNIAAATDNGCIIVGTTRSATGGIDAWFLRIDAYGDTIWTRTYGAAAGEEYSFCYLYSISPTPDGGYVSAGMKNTDVWVIRINAHGDTIWTRSYGGGNEDYANDIDIVTGGGYIVTGSTRSFSAGNLLGWVLRLDESGDTIWTHTYGGVDGDHLFSAITLRDSFILTGSTNSFSAAGSSDGWLLKIDAAGNTIWNHTYGGDMEDLFFNISPTIDGGYITAGGTNSFILGGGAYVVKIDGPSGFPIMVHQSIDQSKLVAFAHDGMLDLRINLQRDEWMRLDLLNTIGEKNFIIADQIIPVGETRLQFPYPHLPSGVYLIRSNGTLAAIKVVIR